MSILTRASLGRLPRLQTLVEFRRCLCSSGTEAPPHQGIRLPDPRDPAQSPYANLSTRELTVEQKYWRSRAHGSQPIVYERRVDKSGRSHTSGRRKSSVAEVSLGSGDGEITVNGKNYVDVFHRPEHRFQILRPLEETGLLESVSIESKVRGGGTTGQAEAIRHGIAKALQLYDPTLRPALKKNKLLTRDIRVVEMKKFGRKKARKSSQWVKR